MPDDRPLTLRRRVLGALAALAPYVLRVLLRGLQWSLRVEYVDAEALHGRWGRGEQAIISFWHNRLLLLPVVAAAQPMCIMVSHHRDGEMATRLLASWRISTVRGSASRGGVRGFLRLVHAYRRGENLAVLPDGPRGPRYVAKPGVVHLAKATGGPIFPVAWAASHASHLGSWDRLIIPWPFSRVVFAIGEPLSVASHASADELEASRVELERRLTRLTESVEARFAVPAGGEARRAA
ncbi:MAG: lysophospholipid acyltransferase family protein [Candidatus Binatia bacterium]